MSSISGSSETFPNRPTGGPSVPPPAPANGRRTMADITRLFMGGAPARPDHLPQRLPPHIRPATPSPASPAAQGSTSPAASSLPAAVVDFSSPMNHPQSPAPSRPLAAPAAIPCAPLTKLQVALTDPLAPHGHDALLEAARMIASTQHCTVGVIACVNDTLTIQRVDAASPPRFTQSAFHHPQSPLDLQLSRTLVGLRDAIDTWLIAAPSLDTPTADTLLDAASDWLLFCGTDNDALIACYRTLKRVRAMVGRVDNRQIRLYVRTADRTQAVQVHGRLNHVAEGFLDQQLQLMGAAFPAAALVETLASFSIPPGDALENAWLGVIDFIHEMTGTDSDDALEEPPAEEQPGYRQMLPDDSLTNVLDASERAALAFDNPAESEPPSAFAAPAASTLPAAPVVSTPAAVTPAASPVSVSPAAPVAAPGALHAVDMPADLSDRALVWRAVTESLLAFGLDHVVLEVRPPEHPAAQLTVDPAGRLHLWTLLDPHCIAGWSVLQQWAQLHRPLIALTRRDLSVNTTLAVQMHVVLPLDAVRQPFPASDDAVRWYRLERLAWGPQVGLIVVPCGD